jgi:VanZ family protein
MFIYKKEHSSIILIIYFISISILFFLPASAFPKSNWVSIIYLDKWIHIVLFLGLSFLCCCGFYITKQRHLILLLGLLVIYGLIVEVIQEKLVENRSFALGDLAADFIGSCVGIITWKLSYKRYIKK